MKEYYTIKKGNFFSNCMRFGHAGGGGFEYNQCFLSFGLAEETFLASPPARRCPTEGTLGHLRPRPACPRRLQPRVRAHRAVQSIKLAECHSFATEVSSQGRQACTAGQENVDTAPLRVAAGLQQRGGPSAVPTSLSFLFIVPSSPAKCARIRSLLWKSAVSPTAEQTSGDDLFCRARRT